MGLWFTGGHSTVISLDQQSEYSGYTVWPDIHPVHAHTDGGHTPRGGHRPAGQRAVRVRAIPGKKARGIQLATRPGQYGKNTYHDIT